MERKYPGYFITLEGPDGGGKSTQGKNIVRYLEQLGLDIFYTREPGGTVISEEIRTIVHDLRHQDMHPRTEVLLYASSRAQHVGEKIIPHLKKGGIVVCDRFADSSRAYQGYGHGFDLMELEAIQQFATQGLSPNLTLLFDLDPEVGIRRRKSDGEWNRLDAMALEFHKRVREGYLQLIQKEPNRWVVVDASKRSENVWEDVRVTIIDKLTAIGMLGVFGG